MALGLDDAVLGWLVAAAGNALFKGVRGDRTKKAMRQLVRDATIAAVAQVGTHLDSKRAKHLCDVLLGHGAQDNRMTVSSPAELQMALQTWITSLDNPPNDNESSYLEILGVDAGELCQALTEQITSRIRDGDRIGDPLGPVAEWLFRSEVRHDHSEMKQDLDQIKLELSRFDHLVEPPSHGYGGLPGGTPDFTGRHEALDELAERVQAHDLSGTVVSIHAVDGMAGVGKTELALRAAHQHKNRYPDGQCFINLHGYTDGVHPMPPDAALEELLRWAGVAGRDIPPDLASRAARWQAIMASKRALVVLDNALDADQVRPLLPHAPGCLVLITSRSRLTGLPGARTLRLDVLPRAEAIKLFCRIADQAVDLEHELVARIVDVVGHLPVAVRVVAAQVSNDYSVVELAGDLAEAKQRLALTDVAGPLGAGVAAAFETSTRRLDPPHQHAFHLLGVYPGPILGVPQFAALADLPPSQAAAMLRALASRNLLTPVDNELGHRRWQMHDLLRDYVRNHAHIHMSEGQRSAASARLTTWYSTALDLITSVWESAGKALSAGPAVEGLQLDRPDQAWEWLAAEQDNLVAHAAHSRTQTVADVSVRYAGLLYQLNYYAASEALCRSAIPIYRQTGDRSGQADALVCLGQTAIRSNEYSVACRDLHAALTLYQQTGDRGGQAEALNGLGEAAIYTSQYSVACEHLHAALTLYQRTGDRGRQAKALNNLGTVARDTGDYAAATEHIRAALTICEGTGDQRMRADALANLGAVARYTGNYIAAAKYYIAALTVHHQTGNRSGQAYALAGLGHLALLTGANDAADKYLRAALTIYQQIRSRLGQDFVLVGLKHLAQGDGRGEGS